MTKGTTKSNGQKHSADKFYTKPSVALECISRLDLGDYGLVIEPSAGSGAFSHQIPGCASYDLFPEDKSVTQMDWFDYQQTRNSQKTLVIGNPPFGQQNSLAVRFINHAAIFADTVAFILPLSFRKESIINKLNKHLILREEMTLEKKAFLLDGEDYAVPCAFFIWDYDEDSIRVPFKQHVPNGFSFVKKEQDPHLAIQRVGGRSGKASADWLGKNVQTNYFIRLEQASRASHVVQELEQATISSRDDSVGPRSLSKNELTEVLNRILS